MSYLTNPYRYVVADNYPNSLGTTADMTETSCTVDTSGQLLGAGCIEFNGSSSYSDLGGVVGNWSFLTQAFSFSLWIYPKGLSHQDVLFDSMNASTANVGFMSRFNASGGGFKLMVGISDGTTLEYFETTNVWGDDSWQNMIITYDGTTMTVYRNNVNIGSGSVTSNTNTPSYVPRLGWSADGTDNKYEGLAQEFVLFDNRVLSSGEISSLYNSGSGELVSTVFGAGDRTGLIAYYNMQTITSDTIINNAIPT